MAVGREEQDIVEPGAPIAGTRIMGSVQAGHDFVGRDKIIYGDEIGRDKIINRGS